MEEIINYINDNLDLAFIKEKRGLAERITQGEKVFPAEYCGKGEYKSVNDFDFTKGLIYHRLTGPITTEQVEENIVGCEELQIRTYPLRLVGVILKSLAGQDKQYGDIKITETVINKLDKINVKELMKSLGAVSVNIPTISFQTNRDDIHAEEYEEIKMSIGFEFAYIAIDYNVAVTGELKCFENICD